MAQALHVRDQDPPEEYYRFSIHRLRLGLMFFMTLYLLGVPTEYGATVRQICAFVPLAFYTVSGYLVLRRDGDRLQRIKRAIKRTAIVFVALLVFYLLVNWLFCYVENLDMLQYVSSKKALLDFLLLNRWPFPVGNAIWYVQALLYTYVLMYFFEKAGLFRFDWLFLIILFIFVTVTDEFASILGLEFFGYAQWPAGFLTRALPYVLLGEFLHRKMRVLIQLRPIWYRVMCGAGVLAAIVEPLILKSFGSQSTTYGHMFSLSIIAITLCMIAFQDHDTFSSKADDFFDLSRWDIAIFYYLCQPVACFITVVTEHNAKLYEKISPFIGIFTFLLIFVLVLLIALIRRGFRPRRPANNVSPIGQT